MYISDIHHNSQDRKYRSPFGAVVIGTTIRLRIKVNKNVSSDGCFLCVAQEGCPKELLPMDFIELGQDYGGEDSNKAAGKDSGGFFQINYKVPESPGLIWYYFKLKIGDNIFYYGNNGDNLGGQGQLQDHEPKPYQITVFIPWQVPDWYKQGVMYQIFVDRFYSSRKGITPGMDNKSALYYLDWYDTPFYIRDEDNGITRWTFFGGNLEGIIEKLDYLKDLGITIIYLNPIFEALSNHKYDTADYMKIDPMFGNEEIFRELALEAGKRGISLILDGVFSHTGAHSIYFNKDGAYPGLGAFQSKDSPYYNWYKFEKHPHKYESWWGVDVMPNVNEMEPSYREFIYGGEDSVIRHWMRAGAKGWRLDVADELPGEFIKEFRIALKETDEEGVLLGEVWEDASNKVSYGERRQYLLGQELDSVMNYPLRRIWLDFILGEENARLTHKKIMSLYENYPKESFYSTMNLIGSHDRIRILTRLGEAPPEDSLKEKEKERYLLDPEARELAIKRLKLMTLIQMFFPGVPCVYYGDEAGVQGYSDPYNRGTYPWGREDRDILIWYKKIIGLRNSYGILKSGGFESFYVGEDIYGFIRGIQREKILVLVNRNRQQTWHGEVDPLKGLKGNGLSPGYRAWDMISGKDMSESLETGILRIAPLEGLAIYISE
ncbi:MAG: glycoside hydrolase family 13 protein [Clostridiales bacterium]|nr:glycoside hydrolase family 13 protein [Clostridiales bacterium]